MSERNHIILRLVCIPSKPRPCFLSKPLDDEHQWQAKNCGDGCKQLTWSSAAIPATALFRSSHHPLPSASSTHARTHARMRKCICMHTHAYRGYLHTPIADSLFLERLSLDGTHTCPQKRKCTHAFMHAHTRVRTCIRTLAHRPATSSRHHC